MNTAVNRSRHPTILIWSCIALVWIFASHPAWAIFHFWQIREIYSNADGSVQFIELFTTAPGQEFVGGHEIVSRNADGTESKRFTFPSDTPAGTANRALLLATPGFGDLPGGVEPDFTIPEDFLFLEGGTLEFVGADTLSYPALPTDGVKSFGPSDVNDTNTPTNFGGQTGSVGGSPDDGGGLEDPIPRTVPKGIAIELQLIVDGMAAPLGMVQESAGRFLIYDQAGLVHLVESGQRLAEPYLDVRSRLVELGRGAHVGQFDERGLLGLALHPNFAENGLLYTYTSEPVGPAADFTTPPLPPGRNHNHQSVIAEWKRDPENPNRVDPNTRRELMRIDEPQYNHNAGTMAFGADGFLYIALGDGGGADDQEGQPFADTGETVIGHAEGGNGQAVENIYGTLLRIDVDGRNSTNGQYGIPADNPFVNGPGLDEIFAYGFRNPYRFSFDLRTGEIYLADVGQNDIEEINIVERGGNFGWNIKEGTFFFDPNGLDPGFVTSDAPAAVPENLIDPIAQYDHDEGLAIIGGFVYRGDAIRGLQGRYIFGDWGSGGGGRIFYLDAENQVTAFQLGVEDRDAGFRIKGFGQDRDGEVYIFVSNQAGPFGDTGRMLKIVPALRIASVSLDEGQLHLEWIGGGGPYIIQSTDSLVAPEWSDVLTTQARSATVPVDDRHSFFRVMHAGSSGE